MIAHARDTANLSDLRALISCVLALALMLRFPCKFLGSAERFWRGARKGLFSAASRIGSSHNHSTVLSEYCPRLHRQFDAHGACSRAEVPLGDVSETCHDGSIGDHVAARYPRSLPYNKEFVFTGDGRTLGEDFLHIPKVAVV